MGGEYRQLFCLTDVQFGSALNRLYRFLCNESFDDWLLTEQMLRLLGRRPDPLLLALYWTAWHDRFSLLTALACVGTHAVTVWMREDDLWIDRLLLTTSSSYVPGGTGPPESTP